MKIFQLIRHTWLIYFCLVVFTTILLLTTVYGKYDELLTKRKYEQLYITKIVKADINSLLSTYESILDLINVGFNEDHQFNQSVLQKILKKSDLLAGFAVFNLDGTLRAKSDNLPQKLFELKGDRYIEQGFYGPVIADKLMISRPIFSPITKKWIIPIRKALIDKQGSVTGFLFSAILINKLQPKWPQSKSFGNSLMLTLDQSFYRLLDTAMGTGEYAENFSTPFTEQHRDEIDKELKKQNLTLEMLRDTEEVVQFGFNNKDKEELHSLSFNKQYQFWTHASRSLTSITSQLLYTSAYYFILYFIFLAVIFFLFKWIIRIEKNKLTELAYKTEHDDLTGCYNRSVLPHLIHDLSNVKKPFSMLYIDLDNFKNINDSFGHKYGDALLKAVSLRIQQSLTGEKGKLGDLIRYSGDQFILLIEMENKQNISDFAKKLLDDLAEMHCIFNHSLTITSSIGIACYPRDAKQLDTLISYAENSMLIAKKTKNHYLFFSQEVHQHLLKQTEIEQALRTAIEKNEISLVYQPQMDTFNKLYGVEALVRWESKTLGVITPDIFIPIAEKTGLMPILGQHIMNRAMYEISSLQRKSKTTFALSINVSVRQFVQTNFFEVLIKSILYFGEKNLPITIEITESLFIESIDVLRPIFTKMKDHNISLALDDFGTGYSSLSMLRDVPIDELKIDKSFVQDINKNKTDKAMVKSIIGMGKNLNMRVLAEGVETAEHAEILAEYGCDLFQGYHFSRALSIKELEQFIQQRQ